MIASFDIKNHLVVWPSVCEIGTRKEPRQAGADIKPS